MKWGMSFQERHTQTILGHLDVRRNGHCPWSWMLEENGIKQVTRDTEGAAVLMSLSTGCWSMLLPDSKGLLNTQVPCYSQHPELFWWAFQPQTTTKINSLCFTAQGPLGPKTPWTSLPHSLPPHLLPPFTQMPKHMNSFTWWQGSTWK